MAWIESHTVLMRHRKVADLARKLRLRRAHALGHLHALWHAALEQQDDGDLSSWSDEFIAEVADYPGDAPQFVRLLVESGFLDGKKIHDWPDHAGAFLRNRYASSNRQRLVEIWQKHGREYGRKSEPTSENGEGNDVATSTQQVRNHTIPNQTIPNQPTTPKRAGEPPGGFVRFWESWPRSDRKVNKKACITAWATDKCEAETDDIVRHVEACKRSETWTKNNGQFVPLPLTYLHQRRWDALPPAQASGDDIPPTPPVTDELLEAAYGDFGHG